MISNVLKISMMLVTVKRNRYLCFSSLRVIQLDKTRFRKQILWQSNVGFHVHVPNNVTLTFITKLV